MLKRSHLRSVLWMIAAFGAATVVRAQEKATLPTGRISVALTYNANYAGLTWGQSQFWMQGGSVDLSGEFYRGLSVVANVTGLHAGNTGEGIPLNLVVETFGPRYRWRRVARNGHAWDVFGEGLVGEAHGFRGLFPTPDGTSSSASSLAIRTGGGVDLGLSRHVSFRVVQIDWLRAQLPNATTNVQNNLLVGTGIVFHSGAR